MKRTLAVFLLSLTALAIFAIPASASGELTIGGARGAALSFAQKACYGNEDCGHFAASGCKRTSPSAVVCEIVNAGIASEGLKITHFTCKQKVRVTPHGNTYKVTPLGKLQCH